MKATLVYLTHLDYDDTESIMLQVRAATIHLYRFIYQSFLLPHASGKSGNEGLREFILNI